MEIVNGLFVCIAIWYLANIIWLIYGFLKVKTVENENLQPKTKFSIIVPFRNEQENLPKLLSSIEKLNYPNDLFEVILVDDDSDTRFQISDFRFRIVLTNNARVSKSPKKDAINTAIAIAKKSSDNARGWP